jgi:sarcosine oxidase, subunit beta
MVGSETVQKAALRSDVTVVGAGIIGAACAYELTRRGLTVTVVEALSGPAEGSSGRSFASVRGQWADPLNIEISWRSICRYRDFATEHGVDVGYRPTGYLLLVPDAMWGEHLAAVDLQRAHGVPVDVLSPEAAQLITPFAGDGVAGATWGPADGVVDPHLVTAAYLSMARDRGAKVCYRHRVTAIESDPATAGWILTASDASFHSQHVVNAAGGWSGELAALAGLTIPVVHSRRNVYSCAPGAVARSLPMTIDLATGVYLRSDGPRLLFGATRPDEVDGYNIALDWPWMEAVMAMAVERFPWLGEVPLDRTGAWAGTYDNSPDLRAIVGAHPGAPTWVNVCGLSGHGVMQAPELGRLVAEQVADGAITSLDVRSLELTRFAGEKAPVPTAMVF